MASLEKRNGSFRVSFRFGGQKFNRSLKTLDEGQALAALARLEDTLRRVELGWLTPPNDTDVATFLLSEGKLEQKPKQQAMLSLDQLFQQYFDQLPPGALEASTIEGMEIHRTHLCRLLGAKLSVKKLNAGHLQDYITKRSSETGLRGKNVSAATIHKELVSLRVIWNWAKRTKIVAGDFPNQGLIYPKLAEKRPFLTLAEIQQRLPNLSEEEQADYWDCAFLTLDDIAALLKYVQQNARHEFVYPLFVFAAHTGARRSEMMRSQLHDLDFASGTILIHEKKRARGKHTTRRVPMSSTLRHALQIWLKLHPGGPYTFCHQTVVPHSKKERSAPLPLTRDEMHDHFQRTLNTSTWEPLRGWHVFRHSFISNCASQGVDQRMIDAWVGHTTEEMRRRYRHLIPNIEQAALQSVFQ